MSKPLITVVIPTYKDWARLAKCLEALAAQTFPQERMEIIVVNNHPDDSAPEGFKVPGNCTIIRETRPGSYAARNAALGRAQAEIIAFTDSDCVPDEHWIAEGLAFLRENDQVGRIAGRIKLFYKSDEPSLVECYEQVYAFNQDIYVKRDGTGVTANMFVRRSLFDTVGLFNDQLLSGGDYEWSVRARKAGYAIKYADKAVVYHPARHRMTELVGKAKRVGGGQASFKGNGKSAAAASVRLLYDLRPPVKSWRLIGRKGKTLSLGQKLSVAGIRYYLSLVSAFEKFRVQSGKEPSRV